jgi:hypothetical protein
MSDQYGRDHGTCSCPYPGACPGADFGSAHLDDELFDGRAYERP